MNKFSALTLQCSSCSAEVIFALIDDIECDWGSHKVIQCPNCEELFLIDHMCPAFSSLLDLIKLNHTIFNQQEKLDYLSTSHPC